MSTVLDRRSSRAAAAAVQTPAAERVRLFFRARPAAFATILTVVMLAINIALQPHFGPTQQLAAFAPMALAAMATAAAVLGGGIDLSISAQMTFASILLVGYLTPAGLGGYIAIPILLVTGAILGTLNGLLAVVLHQSFHLIRALLAVWTAASQYAAWRE